ncbi:MAG TPA: ADP-forming succinate--CoA ligase subunit beta [Rhodospirillales bacterium]
MNLHEFQAKALLKAYGVPVPPGDVAASADEAAETARRLKSKAFVVKAQVHAGGRGKAGGVKIVKSPDAARQAAAGMLGTRLVTSQTGAEGKRVRRIYVEEACDVAKEIYLAALVDRSLGRVSFLASASGGVDIEEAAHKAPGNIIKLVIDPQTGLRQADAQKLAKDLGLSGKQAADLAATMAAVYKAFLEKDASLIEINPLGVTATGDLYALDVKMIVDDNAIYRHQEFDRLWEEAEVDPAEIEARRHELNFVHLEGDIGVMVTGAGLALGILDMIKDKGASAADFMDVRPVATREQVAAGIRMLLGNPNVKAILVVAIGGGVLRCDTIAEGIALACKSAKQHVPVVVRFAGTAKELAELALTNQRVGASLAGDLDEAVDMAVRAAKTGKA